MPRAWKRAYWSVDEARQFLESAKTNKDPLYAGYVLMLILGLRRGELLGLGWEDVDLQSGEARIGWQVQRVGGELVRRRTKTHSSDASLPLPDICIHALKQRRRDENMLRLAASQAWANTDSS